MSDVPVNPYPRGIAAGKALLIAHGWTTFVELVRTCTDGRAGPGARHCGPGVAAGDALDFTIKYPFPAQCPACDATFASQIASWKLEGIKVTPLSVSTADTVTACGAKGDEICSWGGVGDAYETYNWGGGWQYDPDFYPVGDSLLTSTCGLNYGGYTSLSVTPNDAAMNPDIVATDGGLPLTAYALHAAKQVPVSMNQRRCRWAR